MCAEPLSLPVAQERRTVSAVRLSVHLSPLIRGTRALIESPSLEDHFVGLLGTENLAVKPILLPCLCAFLLRTQSLG